jgi:hypothetical protein
MNVDHTTFYYSFLGSKVNQKCFYTFKGVYIYIKQDDKTVLFFFFFFF